MSALFDYPFVYSPLSFLTFVLLLISSQYNTEGHNEDLEETEKKHNDSGWFALLYDTLPSLEIINYHILHI